MKRKLSGRSCLVVALLLVTASAAGAQQPAPPAVTQATQAQPAAPKPAIVPLKVQVTITRYQKEAVTSRLPFTLWVNANDPDTTTVNVGASVPLLAAGPAQPASYTYQSVGTNIQCSATSLADNRFRLNVGVQDTSVMPAKEGATPSLPYTQSLRSANILLVREGQTTEFLSTTDKVTGEVTKIDVVVTVLR